MTNDIRFEIYPDSTGKAIGSLFLDDGETQRDWCRFNYTYDGSYFTLDDGSCAY